MDKSKKYVKKLLIIGCIFIGVAGFSKLLLEIKTNINEYGVSKAFFSDSYYIKAEDEERKLEKFKDYMLQDGWNFSENYNKTIIFRKGNLQKEIPINSLINI
ncbi:MAG: hypothetical protein ACRDA5_14225 [Clostridium sp.]